MSVAVIIAADAVAPAYTDSVDVFPAGAETLKTIPSEPFTRQLPNALLPSPHENVDCVPLHTL